MMVVLRTTRLDLVKQVNGYLTKTTMIGSCEEVIQPIPNSANGLIMSVNKYMGQIR